jgi:type IV pilus assembly protein PilE
MTIPRLSLRRAAAGVTLIELMIAVAIVAILTAIAYPSYQAYVARSNRGVAAACLSQYAQFMERYYTTNLTYVGAAPVLGCRNEGNLNLRYTIAVNDLAQGTYTLTATPVGVQVNADARCGTLRVDQTGARTVSGPAPVTECW